MKENLISWILCSLAGALLSLGFPSFLGDGWFPLIFIAFPIFFWRLERSKSLSEGLLASLFFNLGFNLCGYYWIPHTMREFGQLPYPISVLLGLLFTFILQPHWWAYSLWKHFRPAWSWNSQTATLTSALIMTLLERYIPQQFPTYAGSPWLNLAPYIGLAPIVGAVTFSFITYWTALETVVQLSQRKFRSPVWICLFLFFILNASFPLKTPQASKNLNIRMVQANIGNFLKVSSEEGSKDSFETISDKYEGLSVRDGFKPDLIMWPETAYAESFFGEHTKLHDVFIRIMEKTNAELLIGGYDEDPDRTHYELAESVYNSSLLLSENKLKTAYHKNILLPFGETLPFGPFNKEIARLVPAVSLFARGYGTPLMQTKSGLRFVTPICYEILDSNFMRGLLREWGGNHFIANHTNDSWYGETAEPYQHLFLSRWRAVEFNLPILRSTNTGITSVIYPDGSESHRLKIGETGTLDLSLGLSEPQETIYLRFGVLPLMLIFSLLLGISIILKKN